jgi:hypothetical protein
MLSWGQADESGKTCERVVNAASEKEKLTGGVDIYLTAS